MKLKISRGLVLACATLLVADAALAQPPRVPQRPRNFGRATAPPISPNLMLINPNNTFEQNYLQTLRSSRDLQQLNQNFSTELDTLERDFYQNRSPTPPSSIGRNGTSSTGHPTMFFNYGGYYRLGR